jgi:hypothetical protein
MRRLSITILFLLVAQIAQAGWASFQANSGAFNISIMPTWSAAVRAMRVGSANARVLILSDSTAVGFGAPTPGSFVGSTATSWPTILQSLLNGATNLPSSNHGFFNDGNVRTQGQTLPQLDSRVVLGAGWASNLGTYMGGTGTGNTTTTNALAFTPGVSFDTIEVYYLEGINGGFTTDIGGASLGTTTTTIGAGASIKKAAFTAALGNNTVNVKWNSTGTGVVIIGVNTYVAANKSIHIFNASGGGYTIDNVFNGTSDGYQAGVNIGVIAPHLTIICLTINDWKAGTNTTTFNTKTQSLIAAAQVYGDVIVMTGVPSDVSVATQAVQDGYTAVYQTLSINDTLRLVDMKANWTSYTIANAAGDMSDTAHPNQAGYAAGVGGLTGLSQLVFNAMTTP